MQFCQWQKVKMQWINSNSKLPHESRWHEMRWGSQIVHLSMRPLSHALCSMSNERLEKSEKFQHSVAFVVNISLPWQKKRTQLWHLNYDPCSCCSAFETFQKYAQSQVTLSTQKTPLKRIFGLDAHCQPGLVMFEKCICNISGLNWWKYIFRNRVVSQL